MTYGTTIKLNEVCDFAFDPAINTFALISDVDNLVQAITILLKTFKGELKSYPTFGINFPQLLEKNISDDNIKYMIVDAIKRDPRIKSIDQIILTRDRRILNVYISVTTNSGAILDFKSNIMW